MSVVIQLQNLPLYAKSRDIRHFFRGLRIPNGGVHILGGEKGTAFIVFESDEDARLAMRKDGSKMEGTRILLLLSSHMEMHHEIENIKKKLRSSTSPRERDGRIPLPSRERDCRSPLPSRERDSRSPLLEQEILGGRVYQSHSPSRRYYEGSSHRTPALMRSRSPGRSRKFARSTRMSKSPERSISTRNIPIFTRGGISESPIRHSRSTNICSMSPKRFPRSPRCSVSPKRLSTSPRRFSRSPRILSRSPRRFSRSPRRLTRSPRRFSRSPRRLSSSPRRLSRSPRRLSRPRLSRSPRRLSRPRLSRSPRMFSRTPDRGSSVRERPRSPISSYQYRIPSPHDRHLGESYFDRKKEDHVLKIEEVFGVQEHFKDNEWGEQKLSWQERQTLFEQKIAEALAAGLSSMENNSVSATCPKSATVPQLLSHSMTNMQFETANNELARLHPNLETYQAEYNQPNFPIHNNSNAFSMPDSLPQTSNVTPNTQPPRSFPPHVQSLPGSFNPPANVSCMEDLSSIQDTTFGTKTPLENIPPDSTTSSRHVIPLKTDLPTKKPVDLKGSLIRFYASLSGLDKTWDERTVQNMLRGVFLPLNNIKFELDGNGLRTGTVHIKLCNRTDFRLLLSSDKYTFAGRCIEVRYCNRYVRDKYFLPEIPTEGNLSSTSSGYGNFYLKMVGLPGNVSCEQIVDFFAGLEVTDVYIVFGKDGRGNYENHSQGSAFVAFGCLNDYKPAFLKNKKQFLNSNRTILLSRFSKGRYLILKADNEDHIDQSTVFVPVKDGAAASRVPEHITMQRQQKPRLQATATSQVRPLCTLLTGLPINIRRHKIMLFFRSFGTNPGKIHILMDDKKRPNGRAFVEFYSVPALDAACNCSGKKMGNNTISVKQILYDEMIKGLESQVGMRNKAPQVLHKYHQSYSAPQKETHQMQFPQENSFRAAPNDREYISGRTNIQVFEYENDSRMQCPGKETGNILHGEIEHNIQGSRPSFDSSFIDKRLGHGAFPSVQRGYSRRHDENLWQDSDDADSLAGLEAGNILHEETGQQNQGSRPSFDSSFIDKRRGHGAFPSVQRGDSRRQAEDLWQESDDDDSLPFGVNVQSANPESLMNEAEFRSTSKFNREKVFSKFSPEITVDLTVSPTHSKNMNKRNFKDVSAKSSINKSPEREPIATIVLDSSSSSSEDDILNWLKDRSPNRNSGFVNTKDQPSNSSTQLSHAARSSLNYGYRKSVSSELDRYIQLF